VFASSLTVTVKANVPALVELPPTETDAPVVALSEAKDGPLIDHVKLPVPPVAESGIENVLP
jgi:hypothetical protein